MQDASRTLKMTFQSLFTSSGEVNLIVDGLRKGEGPSAGLVLRGGKALKGLSLVETGPGLGFPF